MKIDEFRHSVSKTSQVRNMFLAVLISTAIASCFLGAAGAQTAAPGASKAPAKAPAGAPDATLLQLMRGIMYPDSNLIFAAQGDLTKIPQPADPSQSPNPLTSSYGGWQAVENASLAIAEASRLLVIPGRVCSNGNPVPVQKADWQMYVAGLRKAGLDSYKAAKTKNTDNMVDASGEITDACGACHDVYRDKQGGVTGRCPK